MGDTEDAMRTIAERLPLVAASAMRTLELIGRAEHLPDTSLRWRNASRTVTAGDEPSGLPGLSTLRLCVMSPGIAAQIAVDLLPQDSLLLMAGDPEAVVEGVLETARTALASPNHEDFSDEAHRAALRTAAALRTPDRRWHVMEGTPAHGPGFCGSIETGARGELPASPSTWLVVGPGARLPIDEVQYDHRRRPVPHVLMRISRRQMHLDLDELDPVAALRLLADDDRKAA